MSEQKYPVKRNGEYEVEIDKLAFGGSGIARMDNYVIFVKDTLPGDRALIRIQKRKRSHAEARLICVLRPAAIRKEAPCPYFQWCGGCTWQNMDYADQLHFKREIVRESLAHIGGLQLPPVETTLPSDQIFGYRNKMEFSFSDKKWLMPEQLGDDRISRYFALGLHVPGTFDKILHIDQCLLQNETANEILRYISDYAQKNNLEPYGIRSHEGYLRFLVLRTSHYNDKILVNIVTAYDEQSLLQPLADELMERFGVIAGVVNTINERLAQVAFGQKEILLAGVSSIQEKLGGYLFHISANSFFQTNTAQAEKLYGIVLEYAGLEKRRTVWDLYSGTGTIGLFLAREAENVIGFELIESAVRDAVKNAAVHGIENIQFIQGDILEHIRTEREKPDVIVTDPPRAGMHEKITRQIAAIRPERIVYVSCNPTTLARDLAILAPYYDIRAVQPVDMFPQTYHIETVVKLEKKHGESPDHAL